MRNWQEVCCLLPDIYLRLWKPVFWVTEKLSTVRRLWGGLALVLFCCCCFWVGGWRYRDFDLCVMVVPSLLTHRVPHRFSPWNRDQTLLAGGVLWLSVLAPLLCRVQPLRVLKRSELYSLQNGFLGSAVLSAATRESLIVATWLFSDLKFCHSIQKWVTEALSERFHFNEIRGFHCVWLPRGNALCYEIRNLCLPPLKKNPQQQSISLLSFLLSFVSRLLAAVVCCL